MDIKIIDYDESLLINNVTTINVIEETTAVILNDIDVGPQGPQGPPGADTAELINGLNDMVDLSLIYQNARI